MSILSLPSITRTTQPQSGSIRLNTSNPITRGIDVAFVRLDQPGIVGSAKLTKSGNPALIAQKYGQGCYFGGSTSDALTSSLWPVLPDGVEYTYLCVAQIDSTATLGYFVNGDDSTSGNRSFQFRVEAGGAPTLIGFNTAVSNTSITGSAMAIGQTNSVLARVTASTLSLFQNGVKTASGAAPGGTIKGQNSSLGIEIGNRQFTLNLHGSIGLLVRWPRALSDIEAQKVTANPWQLFKFPQRALSISAASGIVGADGSSIGTTTLSAISAAIAGVYGTIISYATASSSAAAIAQVSGTSVGVTTLSSVANSIAQTSGSVTGTSSVSATSNTIFNVVGSSGGIANTSGTTASITQSSGASSGSSSASSSAVSISTANGSATGSATLSGSGIAIWQVGGSSAGIATVYGTSNVSGGIVGASGTSSGASTASGVGQSLAQAIAQAMGSSSASGTGVIIAASTGASASSSSATGNANAIVSANGLSAGTSTVQSTVVVVFQSSGMSLGASTINAVSQAIKSAIGASSGSATVSGITQGGIHYTGYGDQFNATITFSKYIIELQPKEYSIRLQPKYSTELKR